MGSRAQDEGVVSCTVVQRRAADDGSAKMADEMHEFKNINAASMFHFSPRELQHEFGRICFWRISIRHEHPSSFYATTTTSPITSSETVKSLFAQSRRRALEPATETAAFILTRWYVHFVVPLLNPSSVSESRHRSQQHSRPLPTLQGTTRT